MLSQHTVTFENYHCRQAPKLIQNKTKYLSLSLSVVIFTPLEPCSLKPRSDDQILPKIAQLAFLADFSPACHVAKLSDREPREPILFFLEAYLK